MNILPKKSWHVRTKKNIERVRRDEAQAAEEEKILKKRIQLAEQEARTELLRKRTKIDFVGFNNDRSEVDNTEIKNQHVNFFQDIEDIGGFNGGTNKEHEEEEKALKEKFEKDIGLLTYLGQNSLEAKGELPWYLKSSLKDSAAAEKDSEIPSSKHKSRIDPLNAMKKFLAIKEKKYGDKEIFVYKKDKEEKKDKKKRTESPQNDKLSKIEELRAKRLKREAEERKRSQKFLESFRKGPTATEPEVILDDRSRQYNSQFNPHLARNKLLPQKDCR